IESMRQYVLYALSQQNEKKQLPFVISENKSGKIIGSTRFYDISIQHKGLSIGYTWLSPAFWRTSINTDCKFLLLSHAFDTLSAIRVQLKTDLRNIRSQNAIKRIGAKQEGIFRKHMILDSGLFRDSMFFSITDDDWQSVKMNLEKKLESPDAT
ncbi:MAG: GNAT family N-acetyltransferase, partial [Leptospira sp.]|nr:GNAT family N-acetyltransferase [Leptospira sp.]